MNQPGKTLKKGFQAFQVLLMDMVFCISEGICLKRNQHLDELISFLYDIYFISIYKLLNYSLNLLYLLKFKDRFVIK